MRYGTSKKLFSTCNISIAIELLILLLVPSESLLSPFSDDIRFMEMHCCIEEVLNVLSGYLINCVCFYRFFWNLNVGSGIYAHNSGTKFLKLIVVFDLILTKPRFKYFPGVKTTHWWLFECFCYFLSHYLQCLFFWRIILIITTVRIWIWHNRNSNKIIFFRSISV